MTVITRKTDMRPTVVRVAESYQHGGMKACLKSLNDLVLTKKVKFPILEFCAHELCERFPYSDQLALADGIHQLKTEGGNVLLGIILQRRLTGDFDQAIEKATDYISKADVWYVCDIIGERVFGYSLLSDPPATLRVFRKLVHHPSHWVVRSLGAGGHYAIKKGLDDTSTRQLFDLLLIHASSKEKEIRQGIGWAAKTTAKFHPSIIADYRSRIDDDILVANWFSRKIAIGLERHEHGKRS